MASEKSQLLSERLRSATLDAHRRVEGLLSLGFITRDSLSYGAALQALEASLYLSIEALAGVDWKQWRPNLRQLKMRHSLLIADLADLELQRTPMSGGLYLKTPGGGLGCLYVLEGSALGGMVIFAAAQKSLGVTANWAGRYFEGGGKTAVKSWRDFLTELNRIPAGSVLGDEAVVGASQTFALFEQSIMRSLIKEGQTAKLSSD